MRVLVFGTFDRLHPGHQFLLQRAAERGDELYVIVARDATVERLKGRLPEENEETRVQGVQKVVPEAVVQLGHSQDYREPLERIRPDLVLLGYDQVLPPGVTEADFPCAAERLPAFRPEEYKSSLRREE